MSTNTLGLVCPSLIWGCPEIWGAGAGSTAASPAWLGSPCGWQEPLKSPSKPCGHLCATACIFLRLHLDLETVPTSAPCQALRRLCRTPR